MLFTAICFQGHYVFPLLVALGLFLDQLAAGSPPPGPALDKLRSRRGDGTYGVMSILHTQAQPLTVGPGANSRQLKAVV